MDSNFIPDIVVSRLPRYLQALQQMEKDGKLATSSQELGERIGISAAQIRKDLSHFGEFGKQGTGYSIPYLIDQLQTILKVKQVWEIALIGAGDLGHAIARYQGFANRGYHIAMVFDVDSRKIGNKVGENIVHNTSEMVSMIQNANIKIAMLTVPASEAQAVAENLVRAGVCAILSYAPIPLNLPGNILVQYIDPIIQLQHMTYYFG
jgi:redox-sensing transcriptional repressor